MAALKRNLNPVLHEPHCSDAHFTTALPGVLMAREDIPQFYSSVFPLLSFGYPPSCFLFVTDRLFPEDQSVHSQEIVPANSCS